MHIQDEFFRCCKKNKKDGLDGLKSNSKIPHTIYKIEKIDRTENSKYN